MRVYLDTKAVEIWILETQTMGHKVIRECNNVFTGLLESLSLDRSILVLAL